MGGGGSGTGQSSGGGPNAALEKLEAAIVAAVSAAPDREALTTLYRDRLAPLLERMRRAEHRIVGAVAERKAELRSAAPPPATLPAPAPASVRQPPAAPDDNTPEGRDRKARGYDHKFHLINPKGQFEQGYADPMKWCEALLAEMEKPKALVAQWWKQNHPIAGNILAGWPDLKIERASGAMHPVLLMQSIAERKGVDTQQ
jgi:hypothetical protein